MKCEYESRYFNTSNEEVAEPGVEVGWAGEGGGMVFFHLTKEP